MCKTVLPVCIETSDDYDWRSGLYDDVKTLLDKKYPVEGDRRLVSLHSLDAPGTRWPASTPK